MTYPFTAAMASADVSGDVGLAPAQMEPVGVWTGMVGVAAVSWEDGAWWTSTGVARAAVRPARNSRALILNANRVLLAFWPQGW